MYKFMTRMVQLLNYDHASYLKIPSAVHRHYAANYAYIRSASDTNLVYKPQKHHAHTIFNSSLHIDQFCFDYNCKMSIRIGVFIPNGAQTLDVACVDILGSMSQEYLSLLKDIPPDVAALAAQTTIAYINSPSQGDEILLTSGATLKATHNYADPKVAPGQLDIVVVPGPDPTTVFDDEATTWLRKHFEQGTVDVLSICTGIFLVGASGIGDGRTVSGPRGLQSQLEQTFPKMKLAGDKYRWVHDGHLWSSGKSSFFFCPFFLPLFSLFFSPRCYPVIDSCVM